MPDKPPVTHFLLGIAQHTDRDERLVIYLSLDQPKPGPLLQARPVGAWMDHISWQTGAKDLMHSPKWVRSSEPLAPAPAPLEALPVWEINSLYECANHLTAKLGPTSADGVVVGLLETEGQPVHRWDAHNGHSLTDRAFDLVRCIRSSLGNYGARRAGT